jgi:hypothetical protein
MFSPHPERGGGKIYGAFATAYFILYNNHVAGTITAQGRDLTKTMDRVNEDYWYNQWHLDFELHKRLCVMNVTAIDRSEPVSIYADTDSLFVSFLPAINHSDWKNIFLNHKTLTELDKKFIVLSPNHTNTDNTNYLGGAENLKDFEELLTKDYEMIIVDGLFIKDRGFMKLLGSGALTCEVQWNWSREVDYIHGMDHFRYGGYFKQCLEDYAAGFGVENKEDFELERISESIISFIMDFKLIVDFQFNSFFAKLEFPNKLSTSDGL